MSHLLEAVMLICFGASWPISVAKAIRTRQVQGKSPLFLILIALGYTSGVANKLITTPDWTIALYLFNLTMVLTDLTLYLRFVNNEPEAAVAD